MKNILIGLMALLIVVGLAGRTVVDTFASFSDIEISQGNYIETAGLDLKVAKCGCDFNDDPYVEPCFEIHVDKGNTCHPSCEPSYFCQLTLWNAAHCEGDQCEHGIAYLHIKNVEGCLSDDLKMRVERWDCRGSCWGCGDRCWVVVKDWTKIGCLECKQIELFKLYASETGKIGIEIGLPPGSRGDSVEWDMAFELLGDGLSDIETSRSNYFKLGCEGEGCADGFWKKHKEAWAPTGYGPSDDFDATFGCAAFAPDITLMKALGLIGGGLNALARQAVAALLNAAHPTVDYALTVEEVIEKVQDAIESGDYETAKGELEAYNNLSCPLGK
jgi:hypothetical protein